MAPMSGNAIRRLPLSIALMLVTPAFHTVARGAGQASGRLAPPVQMTAEDDRRRIMDLLKIASIPPGASASSPATYDEATANPYPMLPDALLLKSGTKVTTAALWRRRRAEILQAFEREIYGRRPKNVPRVRWEVTGTTPAMNGDVPIVIKQLAGRVDNASYPLISVNIRATVNTPANATRSVPVVLVLGGGGMVRADAGPAASPNPCARPGAGVAVLAGRGQAAPAGPSWQRQILSRGWGYAILDTGSVQGDCGAGLTAGVIGLVNKGQPRQLDDWGALSAWAWGASRVLDYLESDSAVDATRVGVHGHSRWGKAALIAMAFDERFAVAYISSSGQGGAKLHRRKFGETVENVASGFYYWMAGNYLKYAGRWDTLPVDSHELIALCAPRPVFLSAGKGPGAFNPDGTIQANDAWVDPKGSFLAAAAAGAVYTLIGKRDLGTKEFPPIDTALLDGDIGFRQHTGGHTAEPTWPTFLTFASRYLGSPVRAITK